MTEYHTVAYKQQKIFPSSRDYKVQDQGAGRPGV